MCGPGAQLKPEEDLLNLLIDVADSFKAFFGMENKMLYN